MDVKKIVKSLIKIEHGFKHIMAAGDEIYADAKLDHYVIANDLLREESYQGRMLGTYLSGLLASTDVRALTVLRTVVVKDDNWRVHEMLAKAFDHYCLQIGYEQALATIKSWLSDPDPKLNRAVIEGLRIWTARPYFKEHPEVAIRLISKHRGSESEYLRKSVGNALRDIGKKHVALVEEELKGWNLTNPLIAYTAKLVRPK